jgi:hypothetical protein
MRGVARALRLQRGAAVPVAPAAPPAPGAEDEKTAKLRAEEEAKDKAQADKEQAEAEAAEAEAKALADYEDEEQELWPHHPRLKYRLRALLSQVYTHESKCGGACFLCDIF